MKRILFLFSISVLFFSCDIIGEGDIGGNGSKEILLNVGERHTENGISISLIRVFWLQTRNFSGDATEHNDIVLEVKIENNSGEKIGTNPLYSWGDIIHHPSRTQMEGVTVLDIYGSNIDPFEGYQVLDGANITDHLVFEDAAADSTSFQFSGQPPYEDDAYKDVWPDFKIEFDRSDIQTVPIN